MTDENTINRAVRRIWKAGITEKLTVADAREVYLRLLMSASLEAAKGDKAAAAKLLRESMKDGAEALEQQAVSTDRIIESTGAPG